MIERVKRHREEMALSDRREQPFTHRSGTTHDFCKIFNGKKQKKQPKKRK